MKLIITLFFIFSQNLHSKDFLELSSENLVLLGLKKNKELNLNQYAKNILADEFSQDYINALKNPDLMEQIVAKKEISIKQKIDKFPESPKFLSFHRIMFYSYSAETESLRLSPIRNHTSEIIANQGWIGLEKNVNLRLNYANLELLHKVKVKKTKFDELEKSRKDNSKSLYWELELELPIFQNKREFQTIVRSGRLYESQKKKLLIAEVIEDRSNNSIIEARLLGEGLSLDWTPIHSYSFKGYRLQEFFIENQKSKKHCKKTTRIKQHQVIVCRRPFLTNLELIENYVGGLTVQIELVATKKLTKENKKEAAYLLMKEFNKGKDIFQRDYEEWSQYGLDFSIYTEVFFDKKTNLTDYKSIFDKSLNNQGLQKVVEIKSKRLKELL